MEIGHYWSSGVYYGLHSIPLPALARIKGGSMALPHSWAGSWGSELAEGLWVLPPKHCSRRGCPCPSAPHPDRNHPKPQPQELLCLSEPAGAVPVRRSVVGKAEPLKGFNTFLPHQVCSLLYIIAHTQTPQPLALSILTRSHLVRTETESVSPVYQSPKLHLSEFWRLKPIWDGQSGNQPVLINPGSVMP